MNRTTIQLILSFTLLAGAGAAPLYAQGGGTTKRTSPLKMKVRVGKKDHVITALARTESEIVYVVGESIVGQQRRLALRQIATARFGVEFDDGKLQDAIRRQDWETAASELYPPMKPVLPYLDLPYNNALDTCVELGTMMMRAARLADRDVTDQSKRDGVIAKYKAAHSVLTFAGKARWSTAGTTARLRAAQCMLDIGDVATAKRLFRREDVPEPGDDEYGVYWLTKAGLAVADGKFRAGIDASVKSLCFANKDIDTFPDALLVSARCYEELQDWYRARDVYYEVARIFPRTHWADDAVRRLRFIMEKKHTEEEEESPIENVFFGLKEDMNQTVTEYLAELDGEKPWQFEEAEAIDLDMGPEDTDEDPTADDDTD